MKSKNIIKQRKLKVYYKHVYSSKTHKVVPEIKISGKWLKEMGFISGKFYQLKIRMNEIEIKIID